METSLVSLARRLCDLDSEAQDVRAKMLVCLTANGSGTHPAAHPAASAAAAPSPPFVEPVKARASPPKTKPPGKAKPGPRQGQRPAELARQAEARVLAFLKANPEGATTTEIAKAIPVPRASADAQARRLAARGEIIRDEMGRWTAAPAPAPAAGAPA